MRQSPRTLAASLPLLAAASLVLTACRDDPVSAEATPERVVVLNGIGQTGVTLGSSTTPRLLRFDPFDGATMTVERDTALSAASAFSGDLVFVADLRTATVQ